MQVNQDATPTRCLVIPDCIQKTLTFRERAKSQVLLCNIKQNDNHEICGSTHVMCSSHVSPSKIFNRPCLLLSCALQNRCLR